jgi:hypothetical protein
MKTTMTIIAAIAVLASCSPIYTDFDWDPDANFASYKTYKWLEIEDTRNATAAGAISDLEARRVRADVDAELAAKGLSKVDEDPDLLVAFYTGAQRVTEVNKTMYGAGDIWAGARVGGGTASVKDVNQGMLVIDLVDAKQEQLVWQGIAENAKEAGASQESINATIDKAIKKLFEKYPPK